MDVDELRQMEDQESPVIKTIKGATMGLVAGTVWGTVVATWQDVPRVERRVALPGLIRTLKMMGNYGVTSAAICGVYIGVEQIVQKYRMKRDLINGAVGGFAAGATVLGFKGKFFYLFIFCCCCVVTISVRFACHGQLNLNEVFSIFVNPVVCANHECSYPFCECTCDMKVDEREVIISMVYFGLSIFWY